jgi:hypothetical protein
VTRQRPAGYAASARASGAGLSFSRNWAALVHLWPPIQRAQDGQSYGFVLYDAQGRACLYLGFSTWHDADRAGSARLAGDRAGVRQTVGEDRPSRYFKSE